jgi:uncharacterized protein with NRDE domain
MCLIVFAWQALPGCPLIVVANRDEVLSRPTAPASAWEPPVSSADGPMRLIAGRDLVGLGTWMGLAWPLACEQSPATTTTTTTTTSSGGVATSVTVTGPVPAAAVRFAALTNFVEPESDIPPDPISRGTLPVGFLTAADPSPAAYWAGLSLERYAGFNLVVSTLSELWYGSNREGQGPRELPPGIYGVSNATLDVPWPKVERAKWGMAEIVADATGVLNETQREQLFALFSDPTQAPLSELPDLQIPDSWRQRGSSIFIGHGDNYGTRATTVIVWGPDRIIFHERTHFPQPANVIFEIPLAAS